MDECALLSKCPSYMHYRGGGGGGNNQALEQKLYKLQEELTDVLKKKGEVLYQIISSLYSTVHKNGSEFGLKLPLNIQDVSCLVCIAVNKHCIVK